MIYQLYTGKIIHLSVEEYLSLTDEDIQYLVGVSMGESPNNPFHGSVLKKPRIRSEDEEIHDDSLDYEMESDEIEVDLPIDLDNLDESLSD